MADWTMMRTCGAGVALLGLLTACASTGAPELDLTASLAPATPALAASAGAAAAAPRLDFSAPGYRIEGEDFVAALAFEERDGRAGVILSYVEGDGLTRVADLAPVSPWLGDGARRFEGVSEAGVAVELVMVAGPCARAGVEGARFATVTAGWRVYEGCAQETGPVRSWSEQLPARLGDVQACLASARSGAMAFVRGAGQPLLVHLRSDGADTALRFVFGDQGRWECRTGGGQARWSVVPDTAAELPGEGYPVFAPGGVPQAGDGCYLWEKMVAADGALIGALGEDACLGGPSAALSRSRP